jgi:SAM-dependent methyltransferase
MAQDLLNLLPRYSPWPARLLGIEPWETKKKNAPEIIREFEDEKWGPLWATVSSSGRPIGLEDVEKIVYDDSKEIMCWAQNRLQLMSTKDARKMQLGLIASTLKALRSSTSIVEIGAGYGQIILNLAKDQDFKDADLIAVEYTQSGVKLLNHLAKFHNRKLTTARCDLAATPIMNIDIPKGSIIFTSYAACYLPPQNAFIENIVALKPAMIIHFEPLFEHCDEETLLGVMQKSYIQRNDYNQNLMSLIHSDNAKGKIDIITEDKQIFGMNPLLPMSVVAWRPCY